MAKEETVGDCFTILKCPECESKKVKIIDFDSHNEIWKIKCQCGHEFTKPVK